MPIIQYEFGIFRLFCIKLAIAKTKIEGYQIVYLLVSLHITECSFYASANYAAPEPLCFCLVRPGFCPVFRPVPNIFLSLRKNTSRTDFDKIRER